MKRHAVALGVLALNLAALISACGDDDDGSIGPRSGSSGSMGLAGSAQPGGNGSSSGGIGGAGGEGGGATEACEDSTVVTGVWKLLADSGAGPTPRFSLSVAPFANELLLFGGGTFLTVASNETWLYDLSNSTGWNTATKGNTAPPARGAQAMAAVGTGSALLFGGQGFELYNDTWLWEDSNWRQLCQDTTCGQLPTARAGHTLVFDAQGERAILTGGQGEQGLLADTWSWSEPGGWQELCQSDCQSAGAGGNSGSAGAPTAGGAGGSGATCCGYPARADHAAALDPETGTMFIHGGHDGNQELASLWSFEHDTWNELMFEGEQPGARSGHVMAFDNDTQLAVIYGGTREGEAVADDLWAYSPKTTHWYKVQIDGKKPDSRSFGSFVFDAPRNQLLLFGGAAQNTYGDLWALTLTRSEAPTRCTCLEECAKCPTAAPDACSSLCDAQLDFPETRCAELPGGAGGAGGGSGGQSANNGAAGGGASTTSTNACETLAKCCNRLSSPQDQLTCQGAVGNGDPETCAALLAFCE